MPRAIIHVDMDAFYASVEQRDRPELRGRPVVVGGPVKGRGVVSAASYEARSFGIHSAMPMAEALRRCPHAVFLPVRMKRYQEVSSVIRGVLLRFTPLVEHLALDESFLDVTGSQTLLGPAKEIAGRIKREIFEATGLTASAGVASNKFVAKIASDLDKPDGLVVVPHDGVHMFLEHLPVSRIWGVGRVTSRILEEMGIRSIGQLSRFPVDLLESRLGKTGLEIRKLACGEDDRPVEPYTDARSVSHEETFARDIRDRETIRRELYRLTEKVGYRLRKRGLRGNVVQLKVRYPDFSTVTRRVTLQKPTNNDRVIFQEVQRLLDRTEAGRKNIRLLGVGISGLRPEEMEGQLGLFPGQERRIEEEIKAVDRIRERFGPDAIKRGIVLDSEDED
ncbi:MAG: DNA polymerase IV [Deltaproteobacteria bacterium]|nr:DNA polymerase IV [Deltaproteobacteria bacterium]MBW2305486.1 DNA polymerase IV [Deltaproteobacteria bacterium]